MKISTNSIATFNAQYGCAPKPAADGVPALVARIGSQLAAVEETIDFGAKYAGIVIAKVISCRPHENSDHLNICLIDDGGTTPDVKRDENGLVQVVCGAPNVRAGLTVAWLPPGSTVPSSIDAGEPFVLSVRAIRGVESNGMLASAKELAIGDSHEGILEIAVDGDGQEAPMPGTRFDANYNLEGDVVIDMENKMFTHRPDLFGTLGVARELAGIQGQQFVSPSWYTQDAQVAAPPASQQSLQVSVQNDIPELVPRFVAIPMSGITVKPSPIWLQIELTRSGVRPINNIVDLTNYYMLLTGQPLHAYDYDKVVAASPTSAGHAQIVVRQPRDGETIMLLNGKVVTPRAEAILITTGEQAIGLGGVMGGADTEVDDSTTNIILECASFDMYSIRRTAMAHGIFTDAVTRFNKGQSPLQNMAVAARTVQDIQDLAGGIVAGEVVDDNHVAQELRDLGSLHEPETVSVQFINERLGLQLSGEEIITLLTNVEFHVHDLGSLDKICYSAPFWRTDIEIPEDIVEEVGRLYGFDKLPLELPRRSAAPAVRNPMLELKAAIRGTLSAAGASELLTYSFVNGNLLDKVGQDRALAYKLSNALSPELQYYRLSLTPSLLDKVHANIKAGYDEFALFEMGKGHSLPHPDDPDMPAEHLTEAPAEDNRLALVIAAGPKVAASQQSAPYFQAKYYLEHLLRSLGVWEQVTIAPYDDSKYIGSTKQKTTMYDHTRTATITASGYCLGEIGEYSASVRKGLKLPHYTAGFEIDTYVLLQLVAQAHTAYQPQSRFPKVWQDICLRVPVTMLYTELYDFVWQQSEAARPQDATATLAPVDIYQRDGETDYKQVTLRYTLTAADRTLTDGEVASLLDKVSAQAASRFGAERI